MNRWAAGQIISLGPLGGARNEAGNILNGGLRIVDGLRDMLLLEIKLWVLLLLKVTFLLLLTLSTVHT